MNDRVVLPWTRKARSEEAITVAGQSTALRCATTSGDTVNVTALLISGLSFGVTERPYNVGAWKPLI